MNHTNTGFHTNIVFTYLQTTRSPGTIDRLIDQERKDEETMSLKDRFFEMKDAYLFKDPEFKSLEEFLLNHLVYHLGRLENLWYEVIPEEEAVSSEFTYNYKLKLEKLMFRLQEIIQFIKFSDGPKIITYVCSEINDLVHEKIIMETTLTASEFNQVSVILTVLNTYFQPEIFTLKIVDIATISKDLRNSVNALLNRLQ